jgi:glycosyltransferase involved in cell wall biosynthesis
MTDNHPPIPPRIHIMTAALSPGDAVGNFAITTGRILRSWGARVYLYADHIAPQYGALARHTRFYPNSGDDWLWYHYSIYADNVQTAVASRDHTIMDFHGISPPHLFAGQNEHLAALCQQGYDLLPTLRDQFDAYVVHSDYSRDWLLGLNFPADAIHKLHLVIDTARYSGEDAELAVQLARLDYLLLVGRMVPQKDVLAALRIFAQMHQQRPQLALILVGTRQQTGKYQQQLEAFIAQHGLQNRVLFTDQVNNPAVLEALFRHARLLLVTSEWESFCVPVAESLYFGTPTAVHNLPPLPEIAGPGGLVFDKADPAAAAAALLALLTDTERYAQMRQTAVAWADRYSMDTLAKNLRHFLHDMDRG